MEVASRISHKADFTAAGQSLTVANGEPIKVVAYMLSNKNTTNTNTYTAHVKNGDTIIAQHEVRGGNTVLINTPFVADRGFSILLATTGGGAAFINVSFTAFYIHPGV